MLDIVARVDDSVEGEESPVLAAAAARLWYGTLQIRPRPGDAWETVAGTRRVSRWSFSLLPPDRPAYAIEITTPPPVLGFCGHSGCGKDTACLYLQAHYGLKFARSMSWHLAPIVAPRIGVPVEVLRGPERHQYAMELFRIGNELRDAEPGVLINLALADGSQLLAGLRDAREIDYARAHGRVDMFIWIDRPVPPDPTMPYGPERCDLRIANDDTVAKFHERLMRWRGLLNCDQ